MPSWNEFDSINRIIYSVSICHTIGTIIPITKHKKGENCYINTNFGTKPKTKCNINGCT